MATLRDLLDAGLLTQGQRLFWQKQNSRSQFEATVLESGKILTLDGQIHNSPSSAARHLNNGISTNGWRVWKISADGNSLSDIRELLKP